MQRLFVGLIAAAMALAPLSASAQTAADVYGSWRCEIPMPGGQLVTINNFMPDGSFIGFADNQDNSGAQPIHLALIGRGTWTLRGADLVEVATSFDLLFITVGEQSVAPGSEVWNAVTSNVSGLTNQETVRTIHAISATHKVVSAGGSEQITCTRP